MAKIKCSRCRKWREVPDSWTFKECVSCHERTQRRNSERRKNKAEFVKLLESETQFREQYRAYVQKFGRIKISEFRKLWLSRQNVKLGEYEARTQKYGTDNVDCQNFRVLLEMRLKLGPEAWKERLDQDVKGNQKWLFFMGHLHHCISCASYYKEQTSSLDLNETKGTSDDYEELKGYSEVFGEKKEEFPEDFVHGMPMTRICSSCGAPLKPDGSCPNCSQNY